MHRLSKICKQCVIPENFPGVTFNNSGVCSLCQHDQQYGNIDDRTTKLQIELAELIEAVKSQKNSYDCIVAYSGGKDSTYTLKLLVEKYGLRCIAVMVDNGYIANQAIKNAKSITEYLGVDLQIFRPAPRIINSIYRVSALGANVHTNSAIKRASDICNSCINIINTHMLKLAGQMGISLIAGGYIGGQVPTDSAVLSTTFERLLHRRGAMEKRYSSLFGDESIRYFKIFHGSEGSLSIINPMLTIISSEEEIIKDISSIGWEKPRETGENSSNCLMNDFGIYVHYSKFGFNPYLLEIADQVRKGLMTRESGIKRANKIPSKDSVVKIAKNLGIGLDDG